MYILSQILKDLAQNYPVPPGALEAVWQRIVQAIRQKRPAGLSAHRSTSPCEPTGLSAHRSTSPREPTGGKADSAVSVQKK